MRRLMHEIVSSLKICHSHHVDCVVNAEGVALPKRAVIGHSVVAAAAVVAVHFCCRCRLSL